MEKFTIRLKELRADKNLSQADLAIATGLTQGAITYWETGQRVPNAKAIIILARFFDVSIDYLLGEKDY
jgi:transcriptional regulator with XRE-family HTH domain